MDDRLETDVLTELIGKKVVLLRKLRDLSHRQSDLIADGDMTRLMNVLSAKQTLLAELQQTQDRLKPFHADVPEQRHWRSAEDREHCRRLYDLCQSLLGEIMAVEQRSEQELKQRRDEAAERLQGSHSSVDATRAYIASPLPTRSNLDLSSDS